MSATMTAKLVRMGNSQGIRIAKPVIEHLKLGPEVQIEVHNDHLVIRRASHPRAGWDEILANQPVVESAEAELAIDDALALTEWEKTEWEW